MMRFSCVLLVAAIVGAACGGSDGDDTSVDNQAAEDAATSPAVDSSTAEPAPQPESSAAETAPTSDATGSDELFPDVIDATATFDGATWTVAATLSSPYDSPERYADAWRVVGTDGTVYGERILTHDHANEQPFTRSHSGIEIPDDVNEVTIEGRDQVSGYGGETFTLQLTR